MPRSPAETIKAATEAIEAGEKAWRDGDLEKAIELYTRSNSLFGHFLQETQSNNSNFATTYKPVKEKILANKKIIERLQNGEAYSAKKPENGKKGDDAEGDEDQKKIFEQIKSYVVLDKPDVRFSELIGLDRVVQEMNKYMILPMRFPHLFQGIKNNNSNFLLHGPPGTGKTHLLRAVATEVDATFIQLSGASLKSKYVGESEKIIKLLFDYAKDIAKNGKPVIIFIDEIDSVAGRRDGETSAGMNSTVNELLVQMDGFSTKKPEGHGVVVVIGATNRPTKLDDAILRRLPKKFYIELPDEDSRRKLWQLYLFSTNDPIRSLVSDSDLDMLARRSVNYSPADINNICQSARMSAAEQTTGSRFFARVQLGGHEKFVPVPSSFQGAFEANIADIHDKIVRMPITMDHVLEQLSVYKKGVSDENLKDYKDFQESTV